MREIAELWLDFFRYNQEDNWWMRKRKQLATDKAMVVQIIGRGKVLQKFFYGQIKEYHYLLYLSFIIKQERSSYREEVVIPYQLFIDQGKVIKHQKIQSEVNDHSSIPVLYPEPQSDQNQSFIYDRVAAVAYANRWWNSYNLAYERFAVDCTNYVSQCLYAGGAPIRGMPNQSSGWWYQGENWSFSWSVAHSLRWYLGTSTVGLQGKEVHSALELSPGDVICYDFQGDGRWDHNTIVVAKDAYGSPLVNAHTDNSWHRYWSYEDSPAWTPNIKYKFFQIGKS